ESAKIVVERFLKFVVGNFNVSKEHTALMILVASPVSDHLMPAISEIHNDSHLLQQPSENGIQDHEGQADRTPMVEIEDANMQPVEAIHKYLPIKKEVVIDGKNMVAKGADASQGQCDDNADDWLPANLRQLKLKLQWNEAYRRPSSWDVWARVKVVGLESGSKGFEFGVQEAFFPGWWLPTARFSATKIQEINLVISQLSGNWIGWIAAVAILCLHHAENLNEELEHLDMTSETNESVDASFVDDQSSEHIWMLRSLSELTVACVTAVILNLTADGKTYITSEELKKHNKASDLWISIQGKVYNVTEWAEIHPGGDIPLMNLAGQEVTGAFIAFHPGSAWQHYNKLFTGYHLKDYQVSKVSKDYRKLASEFAKGGMRISCTAPPKSAPKPCAPAPPSPPLSALFTSELSQPSSSRPKEGMAAVFQEI
nr:delta(8)-fatty-acid desaturase-like [Tanacetum cinerariifolium]